MFSIRFHENQLATQLGLVKLDLKLDLKLFNFVLRVFFPSDAWPADIQ